MDTRTPTTDHDARSHLRVLQGGSGPYATQEDEPARPEDLAGLHEEMAAAALIADLLEAEGLRIPFDTDPVGGRVRATVTDDAGRFSRDVPLGHVTDPLNFDPFSGATR